MIFSKLFEEFKLTSQGKKLPDDCLKHIYKISRKNIIFKDKQCIICHQDNLNYHDYLDGVGYLCPVCFISC